jgi:ATP-dependent Clp protease ATP-binding subunit ClpB
MLSTFFRNIILFLTVTPLLFAGETKELYHTVKAILANGKRVILEEGRFSLEVGYGYQATANAWEEGDEIKVYFSNETFEFENVTKGRSVFGRSWSCVKSATPTIKYIDEYFIELSDGKNFEAPFSIKKWGLKEKDRAIWIHDKSSPTHSYALLDVTKNFVLDNLKYLRTATFDLTNILELENRLGHRIKGQEDPIKKVSDALVRYSMELHNPNKPIGTFLFAGPSGVGKTELCKALARELLGSDENLIRFNMADFSGYHDAGRLFGTFELNDGRGQLTEAIRRHPNSIVLLDEIEKAYPTVRQILLSAIDEGFIVDFNNKRIDCSHCLFVFTTNLGSHDIINLSAKEKTSEEILDKIEPLLISALSMDLYNRLEPVIFHSLSHEVINQLVDLKLAAMAEEFQQKREITLILDPSVPAYLSNHGYTPELGARGLERLIEKKLVVFLSRAILSYNIPNGSTIWVAYDEENFNWSIEWE